MPRTIPLRPEQLRVALRARPIGVDTKAEVIRGYILAQEGPFKSEGRGEFDRPALAEIVRLTNAEPKGLRSRFTHPSMSSDGLGKYLGRAREAWIDTTDAVHRARANLYLSPSSHNTPSGDLGGYVLRLAAEDPDALSSSLVVSADEEYRLNADGTRKAGDDGEPLPPLWRPTKLWASDVVDTGDAVDGILSAQNLSIDDLPDALQRRGWEVLDQLLGGQADAVVRERCRAYVDRYLAHRRGRSAAPRPEAPRPNRAAAARILARLGASRG